MPVFANGIALLSAFCIVQAKMSLYEAVYGVGASPALLYTDIGGDITTATSESARIANANFSSALLPASVWVVTLECKNQESNGKRNVSVCVCLAARGLNTTQN